MTCTGLTQDYSPQLTRECARLESEIGPVAQLLAIARPALSGLGSVRSNNAASSSPVNSAPFAPETCAPPAEVSEPPALATAPVSAAPEAAEAPVDEIETSVDAVYSGSIPGDAGAIKNRASGRETIARASKPAPDADAVIEAAAKRKSHGPTMPPPKKARNTATSVSAAIASSNQPRQPSVPPSTTGAAALLEGGDADWVPPQNQTGDGRTALNDKFGY